MRQRHGRLTILGLCASVLAFVPTALLSLWATGVAVSTEDRNADGRPDVWRHFDRRGQLETVVVDTNFDGRSDVQEIYDGGVLRRRDSDRNFNNQVDLVQEFDSLTQDEIRSVSDRDFDGEADELVLFADGVPTFNELRPRAETSSSSRAAAETPTEQADGPLIPLQDPFAQELAVRAVKGALSQQLCSGAPQSNGLSEHPLVPLRGLAPSTVIADRHVALLAFRADDQGSPRGPPASFRS